MLQTGMGGIILTTPSWTAWALNCFISVLQAAVHHNPAADPRSMRRVIAEDENWNLETVPPLVDACIKHIVDNFHGIYNTMH